MDNRLLSEAWGKEGLCVDHNHGSGELPPPYSRRMWFCSTSVLCRGHCGTTFFMADRCGSAVPVCSVETAVAPVCSTGL